MSIAYGIGFICGLAFVFIAAFVFKKFFFRKKAVYDERQKIEQGKACKAGFYFLLVYCMLFGIADNVFDFRLTQLPVMLGGALISVMIYAVYCIWKEAYFPINQSSIKWIVLLIALGIVNVFIAVMNISTSPQSTVINGMCAVMILIISIVSIIKLIIVRRNCSEESET
ncbi:MAG: hypothetical protein PUB75_06720 [Firmicutes bacterium]|nr:hypothetical protein [Bacillota bacterium]